MTTVQERNLPDPLVMSNGARVRTAQEWMERRRPEVLELFRTHVYGRVPVERPASLRFIVTDVTPGMMEGQATRKQVTISYSGPGGAGSFNLLMFVPAGAPQPAPVFIFLCNRSADDIDPTREIRSPFWSAEEIVSRGYAAVTFLNKEIAPDEDNSFHLGVHGIFDTQRVSDSWGTIAAWAWGFSRALDYLETDPEVDASRVAIVGHSRGGKTALWAGAQDPRFALVISNNSGCTGAAVSRGKTGETIAKINNVFPYWFCENYRQYSDRETELPVDQHELIALIAPRPVYVASATEDNWADPASEFLACVAAEPVYALCGKPGLGTHAMPPPDNPLQQGHLAYHLRTGKHDLTLYDWQRYMDFADKHLCNIAQ